MLNICVTFYYRVDWMSNMGSPGSKIEKAEFSNWRESKSLTFHDFQIRF